MPRFAALLLALDAVLAVLGGVLTHLAYRASRDAGSRRLGLVALGVGAVTLGAVGSGLGLLLTGLSATTSVLAGTALVTVGFLVLAYSLYAEYPGESQLSG